MKYLIAVLVVAVSFGVAVVAGGATVSHLALPSPIVKPQDSCMCGGYITLSLLSRNYNPGENVTYCTYRQLVDGQFHGRYVISSWIGNVGCP
jgi:hypothetical protein